MRLLFRGGMGSVSFPILPHGIIGPFQLKFLENFTENIISQFSPEVFSGNVSSGVQILAGPRPGGGEMIPGARPGQALM